MEPNFSVNNADSSDETRSQEIQNLKTYLKERFGELPVLPGDPRSVPGATSNRRNHAVAETPKIDEKRRLDDRETLSAVSALTQQANHGNKVTGPRNNRESFRHPIPSAKGNSDLLQCSRKSRETGGGAAKSVRFTYSPEQVEALITAFNINPYPTRLDRENLECMLGLGAERIKNWFQNRRSKERRKAKQNNTPLPTPLHMRDMGQATHVSYSSHPHMLPYVKPRLAPSTFDHSPGLFRQYLQQRFPNVMMPQQASLHPQQAPHGSHSSNSTQDIGDAQLSTYRPNWAVPWPAYPYHLTPGTTAASGAPLPSPAYSMSSNWQNSTWSSYYHDSRYITQKAQTATSENGHASDTIWSPPPPPSLYQRPTYTPSLSFASHMNSPPISNSSHVAEDFEKCLASNRPSSQLTWYEDIDRPVDVNSVDDVGEETSLHLEDSASSYSVGDTSQSDAGSYRSLLDDSTNVESSGLRHAMTRPNFVSGNSQAASENNSPFPLVPLMTNGQYANYSSFCPPLAQDLDIGYPSGLDGYRLFTYSTSSAETPNDLQSGSLPSVENNEQPQESDSSELEEDEDEVTE